MGVRGKKKKESERARNEGGCQEVFSFAYFVFVPQLFRPRKSWN